MTKTNAQRQAEYRARRPLAGEQRRVNLWISTTASLALDRLSSHYAVTKQELLEKLLVEHEELVLNSITIDSPAWNTYLYVKAVTR